MKQCTKCGITKGLTEFGWKSKEQKTYQLRCKICRNAEYREKYAKRLLFPKDYEKSKATYQEDVLYDFKFARFLGMTTDEAIQWVEQGYRLRRTYLESLGILDAENETWDIDKIEDNYV